jgi:hypothetical protein
MNGRLYDPYLQRFLSPDPYVQSPHNAQNYNRYAYALNNPLMYTDPSGYHQQSVLDVINYILKNWNNFRDGFTTFFFSGGYCTNFNGGLGSYGDNATGHSGGGGLFSRGTMIYFNFWLIESGTWSFFRWNDRKLGSAQWSFGIRRFVWNGWGAGAGGTAQAYGGDYGMSALGLQGPRGDAGADIFSFSNFDGDGSQDQGGGSSSWGSILFPRGVRNNSSEVIYVLENWGEPWKPLKPNKSWYKPFDAVRAHGVIIKVNDLQTFGPFRINITVVDKAYPNDSGFRYDALDMSINQFLNFFYGLFFDKTKETFIPENTPGWE